MNAVAKNEERRYQFGLRDLFYATTGIAIVAGIAKYLGVGTLPFTGGILLLIANRQGWWRIVQSGEMQRTLSILATVAFAVSLMLPVAKGCNTTKIHGWQVATIVIEQEGKLFYGLATDAEEREQARHDPKQLASQLLLLTSVNLANLLLITAALAPWRWNAKIATVFPTLVVLGVSGIWIITWREAPGQFLIGYWIWLAASYMLAMLMRPPWYAFIAAAVMLGTAYLSP